jgi:hypothetical protein
MSGDERYYFTIYQMPVQFRAPVRGRRRFLRERAFLDDLVAPSAGRRDKERPVPDPATDFYVLDDDQVEAYSAFRHRLDAETDRG